MYKTAHNPGVCMEETVYLPSEKLFAEKMSNRCRRRYNVDFSTTIFVEMEARVVLKS